jgi:23S rRNA pseudouridine955/2504/2580 synthase
MSRVLKSGRVLVNGHRGRPGTMLTEGDQVEVPPLAAEVEREERERTETRRRGRIPTEVRVLHRDEDLLVVEKPPGMPMHAGAGTGATMTLVDSLRDAILAGFGLVHRLDLDTSGVVALVRGAGLRRGTAERFAADDGGIRKVYEALVIGVPSPPEGRIDLPLAAPAHGGRARVDARMGKPAATLYATVEALDGASRLRLEPLTGRTHQIRAHLAAIGHPLLVDPIYARCRGWRLPDPRGRKDARLRRTPLHAVELTLPHPRTGDPMTFRSPLPDDMKYALELLRVVMGRRRKGGAAAAGGEVATLDPE